MINLKAEWQTTILEKNKESDNFKKWFDEKFSNAFPELAGNFDWELDTDKDGPIYILSNNFPDELATFSLYKLFIASKTPKKEKKYFDIPGATDFYSGKVGTVEIDEEIIDIIKELNKKGYNTMASCAGHYIEGEETDGYIWINNIEDLPESKFLRITKSENPGLAIRWSAKSQKSLEKRWEILKAYVKTLPKVKAKAA